MKPLLFDDFELGGREVVLRPLTLADAPALAEAAAESRESYSLTSVPDGLEDTQKYIRKALAQRAAGARFPFLVIWRGACAGTTSYGEFQPWAWPAGSPLQRVDAPDAVEVGGTWYAASAQRTACNTEAKFLLFQHAFEHWRVHSLCLRTDERNRRSRDAIARLGCQFDGLRRAHIPSADGKVRTSAYFSVLAAEWPRVRRDLLSLMTR